MTAKIIALNPAIVGSGLKIDCDQVLECAKANVTNVVVIGFTPSNEIYLASSDGCQDALWLIELAKLHLLQGIGRDV